MRLETNCKLELSSYSKKSTCFKTVCDQRKWVLDGDLVVKVRNAWGNRSHVQAADSSIQNPDPGKSDS